MAYLARLALLAFAAHAAPVTINNLAPRLDAKGNIMDSHDFSIHKYPGLDGYYMAGIAYGNCSEPAARGCDQTPVHCGFQPGHLINIWQSPNLASGSWTLVTTAVSLANRPPGTIFRPDMIYNPNTNEVVLWYNWLNKNGVYMGYAAYTAPGPAGPFTRMREAVNVTTQNATESCGDFHLYTAPDNTPYVIMGCGFHMWIEVRSHVRLSVAFRCRLRTTQTPLPSPPTSTLRSAVVCAPFTHLL